jgi:rhodanese-related sulfurtransferase
MASFLGILVPDSLKPQSRVYDLKKRLDWGEPALTILDVRSRDAFNTSHITGAVSMPLVHLDGQARASLELVRDIYVYGSTDEESVMAADTLRKAGYQSVAELQGGYAAWKAAGFPVEG